MVITEGIGVTLSTWIMANTDGIWSSLAPAKNSLEVVRMLPLTAPKVERATNIGMSQAAPPYILLAKVTATASEPRTSLWEGWKG